jgi:hypothetical protein
MTMMSTVDETMDTEEAVAEALRAHLPDVHVERLSRPDAGADLSLRRDDGSTVLVQVKKLQTVRHDDVIGRIATGALQFRHMSTNADKLVILLVPRASPSAAKTIADFVARYTPEVGWGLIDEQGGAFLEIPSWGISLRNRSERRTHQLVAPAATFSDLQAWLLKILLLREVQPPLWDGPRATTVEELVRLGDVSPITVSRFVKAFEAEDFIRRKGGRLVIVRRGELIRRWLARAEHERVETLHVRSSFGEPSRLEDVFRAAANVRAIVAGFAACSVLGVQHASFKTTELYVSNIKRALEAWDLVACDARDAQFVLLRTTLVESVFRGATKLGPTSVVDVLQAALDVNRHAARGYEQAEYILHDVLGWVDE